MKTSYCVAVALTLWTIASTPAAPQSSVEGFGLKSISKGEGRPMVFVHGSISDHRVWLPMMDTVAATARFVAFDQRYFGTGEWPSEGAEFSIEGQVDDLIELIESLGDDPVDLVTWSSSGEVGLNAMMKRPDLFHSAIHFEPVAASLIEGLPGAASATQDSFSRFGPAIVAMKAGDLDDASFRFLEAVFRMDEGAAEAEPEESKDIWRTNGRTIPGMLAIERSAPTSCDDLGRLDVPTLVVHGERTLTRYAMMAEKVADCLPNALSIVMSDVNHDGPYRRPEDFARLAMHFSELAD